MPAFTASQAKVDNGSKVVQINSGESVSNVRGGDFLVIANAIVEINRAYIGADNKGYFELVKTWPNSNQLNQPCIVIPTTGEFKTVVAALNEANTLVNNNYKAMQDWQTKMGNVTFSNKDGTTTTVKTLKQIEADNAAQLDAYHPYPWAMRKAQFEAQRAANNEKYAASGFVHLGTGHSSGNVNSGLWTAISLGSNAFALGKSGAASGQVGDSKTDFPVVNMAGSITDINSVGYAPSKNLSIVKLPPAEDGTRTYDSATGVSVTHATSAIAFASETATNKVVTDRVDMWGFEGFLREINDNDPFVYDKGLLQSLAPSVNGVTTVNDNVRPITYFAWYDGDINSRGKGVNWQTATEAQRIAIASDPSNNIYFDDATGKFYQWCVRGRSFAGLGNGDWGFIEGILNTSRLTFSGSTLKAYVNPQGALNTDVSYLDVDKPTDERAQYVGFGATNYIPFSDKIDTGLFGIAKYSGSDSSNTKIAVNGECYVLVCGTVSRLNQGAYHPSLNPLGSKKWQRQDISGAGFWYESTIGSVTEKSQAFVQTTSVGTIGARDNTGAIGLDSGRPDSRSYDAIYASGQGGVCRDMRYKASGLTDVDFSKSDLSIKDGTYRGFETLKYTQILESTITNPNSSAAFPSLYYEALYLSSRGLQLGEGDYYFVVNKTTKEIFDSRNYPQFLNVSGAKDNIYYPLSWGVSPDVFVIHSSGIDSSVGGKYTQIDVIGDPVNILLCDDLKGGWIGGWISVIPDGTSKKFPLTRPLVEQFPLQSTVDVGVTWTNYNAWTSLASFDSIKDEWSHSFPSNAVYLINYTTNALSCKPSSNYKPLGGLKGLGGVYVTAFADGDGGHANSGFFCHGLIGKRTTTKTTGAYPSTSMLTSVSIGTGDSLKLPLPTHTSISLGSASAQATGVKALNYNLAENQQGFINYAYTELVYSGSDWGDDGKVHIADNQTTMLDENGNTVLVGTARCVEPLGWIKNDK